MLPNPPPHHLEQTYRQKSWIPLKFIIFFKRNWIPTFFYRIKNSALDSGYRNPSSFGRVSLGKFQMKIRLQASHHPPIRRLPPAMPFFGTVREGLKRAKKNGGVVVAVVVVEGGTRRVQRNPKDEWCP